MNWRGKDTAPGDFAAIRKLSLCRNNINQSVGKLLGVEIV